MLLFATFSKSNSAVPSTSKLTPTKRDVPLKVKLASPSSRPSDAGRTILSGVRFSTMKEFALAPPLISSKPPIVVTPAMLTLSRLV